LNKDIKDSGKKFSSEYQPTGAAKSEGKKRVKTFRESVKFYLDQKKHNLIIDGEEVDLNYQAYIGYKLVEKAGNGDLRAIELLNKLHPDLSGVDTGDSVHNIVVTQIIHDKRKIEDGGNEDRA